MSAPIEARYDIQVDYAQVLQAVGRIHRSVQAATPSPEPLKECLGAMDLTSLNPTDSVERGELLSHRVNGQAEHFPGVPPVAAICVYPSLVGAVRGALTAQGVRIASVAGGFPASQTFTEVKIAECRQCIAAGADEIDIVLSLGPFLRGDYPTVSTELRQIKEACGPVPLKVILEAGALPSPSHIRLASLLAMEAGADFIKTSTGKLEPAATPEAVYIMCRAIAHFHRATGRRVGIKPAGGMATPADALLYRAIVEETLSREWLTPSLFRLGASRLADALLSEIVGERVAYYSASAGSY